MSPFFFEMSIFQLGCWGYHDPIFEMKWLISTRYFQHFFFVVNLLLWGFLLLWNPIGFSHKWDYYLGDYQDFFIPNHRPFTSLDPGDPQTITATTRIMNRF